MRNGDQAAALIRDEPISFSDQNCRLRFGVLTVSRPREAIQARAVRLFTSEWGLITL
ncbi:uncharacterized protein PHALS_02743 [Plasmopara halstedii]|uniref:Uncharacterized protein n=1 Tax=Plasmopara halstedii TaxID=4781 RepID=A0A0N7L781_PLAHL|nr:uncharacterized protein PHALS_02743 [Plasmopara halstedii]CEG46339.1 hypothetical protein PHALS_02743 [Plasmopara halstedii]|eukprot:XP_024582708.1 hypothetical protein PHALS_02743 [Plasmopara halstedii]